MLLLCNDTSELTKSALLEIEHILICMRLPYLTLVFFKTLLSILNHHFLFRDLDSREKMDPFAEQEAWEDHQIGNSVLSFNYISVDQSCLCFPLI